MAAQRREHKRTQPTKRSQIVTWVAGVAALAMLGTIAVVAAGYDAREAPRDEPAVWAMRDSGQYARVNTLTAEIDTVRAVEDPSGIVQAGTAGAVLTRGNGRVWPIDPTLPQDFVENAETASGAAGVVPVANQDPQATPAGEAEPAAPGAGAQAESMPDGTRDVIVAGEHLLVRTEAGEAFVGTLDAAGTVPSLTLIDPFAEDAPQTAGAETDDDAPAQARKFVADAAAIDAEGRVALLSTDAKELRWYSTKRSEFTEVESVPAEITADDLQLAIVAGAWVALNDTNLWRSGSREAVTLDLSASPRLQASSLQAEGQGVLVADDSGLWRIEKDESTQLVEVRGTPAQPVTVGGEHVAAWAGEGSANLWTDTGTAQGELRALDVDDSVKMPGDLELEFRTNGSAALLSEITTGMLWTVPDGRMIPVEQWTLADPPKERDGTVVVADVTEQEPPVAVADAFGVRELEPALLPVLLNDYDPNRNDVLTIVTDGLGAGIAEEFGTVTATPDAQTLVFTPGSAATGSASMSYRITDGVNTSEPATVTLTVVPDTVNTAPEWCAVSGCQRQWPSPEIAPGGTLVMPILEGWVDPEGDPMMLESAAPADATEPVRTLVTDDGRLAVRHLDPNAVGGDITVQVRVADAYGAATTRDLVLQVRADAKAELSSIATTVEVDRAITVQPLARVSGGSGSFVLLDANVQSGTANIAFDANGDVSVQASQVGQTLVALTVRDTGTGQDATGVLRVTAVPTHAKLGISPMRAFVRPLADTTIEILNVIPGANSRALVVQDATVVAGELRADVIEYANVRVSGRTADGSPGRIGSVDVTVAEGSDVAVGRLTVFQVAEQSEAGAIAVPDNATVRAGSVVDIPVLRNDVSAPGQRLVLHPDISGSGAKGELAFASGNTLRYLAPKEPGNYTLSYTTYGASSPEVSGVGQVYVTVVPREGNRDPAPRALTVRLAPGENAVAQVPLSNVDPDGDRVRLLGVTAATDAQLTTTIAQRSSAIKVEASGNAKPGLQTVRYTVRDDFGGEGEGELRIIITATSAGSGAPITYSDYVRMATGSAEKAAVYPLDNDLDPSGGTLRMIEVVPNVPGDKKSPEYRKLAAQLDATALKTGRISVKGDAEPGTFSYRYTAQSSESLSTTDGLIVVQVSTRVGQQAPTVHDTVLSARDRSELEGGGVDVVTDRVFWSTGDVSGLQLSVWGSKAKSYSVTGSRISGAYQAAGDMVPFKLAGTDVTGQQVESFGFLVIPPLNELRLTLQSGLTHITVDEDKTREFALADLIDIGANDAAEFRAGAAPTQRAQAVCTTTARTLTYSAASEAPWIDSCLVSVKLTEQTTWTELSVPVQIVPKQPIAALEALTRTVAPGASETIDLKDMVRWEGERSGKVADLKFEVSGGAASFETSTTGTQVSVAARASAVSGTEDVLIVAVTGAGESRSKLTLRVGEAAKDTPKGATVRLNCTVGSSCKAQLAGAPGEHDPFAGKAGGGLTLDKINDSSCTPYGALRVDGNNVNVAWPGDGTGAGGVCTATFTVRDAQNRVGTGSIELDARGVPRAPVGITPVYADAKSVKLSVALSSEDSYPQVTGVELTTAAGSTVGSCVLSKAEATCTVTGLSSGERHRYFANAVNSVGPSAPTANSATTWAYEPPKPPSISVTPVSWPENTNWARGRVKVEMGDRGDASVALAIDGNQPETAATDGIYELDAGSEHTFSVVATDSDAQVPTGYTGTRAGQTGFAKVVPIGAPKQGQAVLTATGTKNTGWKFDTSGWDANGGGPLTFSYGIDPSQAAVTCTGSSATGSGLPINEFYFGAVCGSNEYGQTGQVVTAVMVTGVKLPQLNGTYAVSRDAVMPSAKVARWDVGEITWGNTLEPGVTPTFTAPSIGRPEVDDVRQCPSGTAGQQHCSEPGTLKPADLHPFSLTFARSQCVPWASLDEEPTQASIAAAFTSIGLAGGTFSYTVDAGDEMLPRSVTARWDNEARRPVTFVNVVCGKPEPPPEPPAETLDTDSAKS